jgi:uroporphyrinogen III methyltransferase/synthase
LLRELNWFEALPRCGKLVVVTRTRMQASGLTHRLAQLGADVLEIPTIRVESEGLGDVQREKLAALSEHFDWVIFSSPNAVDYFFAEFFKVKNDLRALKSVRIAAVGPATAKKVSDFHLQVDLQPKIYTTENLAECFTEEMVHSKRFCLPHGNLADPFFANHLRNKGGLVEEWLVYKTEREEQDATGVRARYLKEGAHWITFTSSSTAENWHALKLQPAPGAPQPKVVSMGPVTSATLRKLGYEIAAESPASTLDSLIATICCLSIE